MLSYGLQSSDKGFDCKSVTTSSKDVVFNSASKLSSSCFCSCDSEKVPKEAEEAEADSEGKDTD